MVAVDFQHGRLLRDDVVKSSVASAAPTAPGSPSIAACSPHCRSTSPGPIPLPPTPWAGGRSWGRRTPGAPGPGPCDPGDLLRRQAAAGFTAEDVELIVRPMARHAKEPRFSMGNDAPLPILSGKPHVLYDYFTERFAQVTNPAIDPLRESWSCPWPSSWGLAATC